MVYNSAFSMLRTSLPEFWRIMTDHNVPNWNGCSWNGCSWWVIFEQAPNECRTSPLVQQLRLFCWRSPSALCSLQRQLLRASLLQSPGWWFKAWENLQEINGFKNQEIRWWCPFRWNSLLGRVWLLPESWYHNSLVSIINQGLGWKVGVALDLEAPHSV